MQNVTVYTKMMCPYCSRAMRLLGEKGAPVNEIKVNFDRQLREEMIQRAKGGSTYPQIFIGETHVGGCDELFALERAGKLDPLLNAPA